MYAIYSTTLYKICKCIKLLNKRAQGSTEAVSYTHLDVYKRQADIPSRLDIVFHDGKVHIQAIPIVDLSELLQYDKSYGITTVSYTHLFYSRMHLPDIKLHC